MTEDSFPCQLYRFAARHVVHDLPPWTAAVDNGEPEKEEASGIGVHLARGMRRSLAAPLGNEIWRTEPATMRETEFFAAIYTLKYGPKVGLIRIPRYVHSSKNAEIFGDLIRRFDADTDALLIDQQYNPGGSLLQMYAMCSYLTDRPLPVPLHQVRLRENDVPEAKDVLEREQYGDELPEEDRPSPYEIAWAQIVFEHAKLGKGVLGDPIPLFGISQIEPASHFYSKPIFLLSNERTSSAGEFLAAILKDNGRAILLGRNTGGAGGCVRSLNLDSIQMRGSLPWTVGWRRNGFIIENIGISPDIQISVTPDDITSEFAQFRRFVGLTIALALHEPKGISVLPELRDSHVKLHLLEL
jgi:C-terminal processing protease CtpA/Prc